MLMWAYPCLLAVTTERMLILMSPPVSWQSSLRCLCVSVGCVLSNNLVCIKQQLEYPRVVGEREEVGAIVKVVRGKVLFVEVEVITLDLSCGKETMIQGGVDSSGSADVRLPLQGAHKITKGRKGSDDRFCDNTV